MQSIKCLILLFCWFLCLGVEAQNQHEIDSLVNKLRTAGRDWTNYSEPLVKIGDPAVPALIENAIDKNLPQWNRRVSMETLNQIHSELWVEPALEILLDDDEIPDLRNRATAGLRGFDLQNVKTGLWDLFHETDNVYFKSNLAQLMVYSDKEMAYDAFEELYKTTSSHVQTSALNNLIKLRPEESTHWLMNALLGNDWRTANLAMDSLIISEHLNTQVLIDCYANEEREDAQWRVVYILGQRKAPESLSFLSKALKNKYWLVRTEAAVALSRCNAELVEMELEPLKNDTAYFVRANINWILRQLGSE